MEDTENSVENSVLAKPQYRGLRPWRKGQSGNPGGRPRKVTDSVEKYLAKRLGKGRTKLDEFVEAVVERAIEGDTPMAKEIWARMEGAIPAQKPEQQSDGGVVMVISAPWGISDSPLI